MSKPLRIASAWFSLGLLILRATLAGCAAASASTGQGDQTGAAPHRLLK